ncbi:pre-mRNA-splicing factor ISY1 protein [Trifolium repens]|jgi:pre-mRNA-splicing factor ISY1|nr:pre-mRNA-splicing factor ISY1 protein [Trifolium repens]
MRREAAEELHRLDMIRKEARKAVRSGEVAQVTTAAREILHEEEEDVVEEERIKDREMREGLDEKEREFVVHVPLSDEKEIEKIWCCRRRRRIF